MGNFDLGEKWLLGLISGFYPESVGYSPSGDNLDW